MELASQEISVATTTTLEEVDRWTLVLEALAIPHRWVASEDRWELWVAAASAAHVRELLAEEERSQDDAEASSRATRRARAWDRFRWSGPGATAFAGVLAILYLGGVDHREQAMLQGGAVRAGEWWRIITALTVHADAGHLLGNLVLGTLLVAVLCGFFGAGVGSALLLAAGAIGNVLSVLLHSESYRSGGASTAVFGVVGLLAAYLSRRYGSVLAARDPLVVGLFLLLYLGVGGARTDVIAHLTGFMAGVLTGLALGRVERPFRAPAQWICGALAFGSLLLAWRKALG